MIDRIKGIINVEWEKITLAERRDNNAAEA